MTKDSFSFINLANLPLIDQLYAAYLQDPGNVDATWRYFFAGWEYALSAAKQTPEGAESPDVRLAHLIDAFRTYGHRLAAFNPIVIDKEANIPELALERFHFTKADLEKHYPTHGLLKEKHAPLKKIIDVLLKTYCRTIGIEYMQLECPPMESWLQERIEPNFEVNLSSKQKLSILDFLDKAELFETFLHKKYVGQKRFSLEGNETLIPMLALMFEKGADLGVTEAVIGMSHRGRLNVLANILGKSYAMIFHEFEAHYSPELIEGTGDVKYHKGFFGEFITSKKQSIDLTLTANPSHLESVDPVVEGISRAKQDSSTFPEVVPIIIHGDAAISGQGVVYETLQLSDLEGYTTGGTIHIVVNNQIGFTTLPKDGRSTRYCTDIAKSFNAPVFHVNAEDPEGCCYVAHLAMELRQRFGCDVFIDLNGYRKYGHNEGDEPHFTQPLEYQQISKKRPIRQLYCDRLVAEKVFTKQDSQASEARFLSILEKDLSSSKKTTEELFPALGEQETSKFPPTAVPANILSSLIQPLTTVPESFHIHRKIERLLKERREQVEKTDSIDWAVGEWLAYSTLLTDGYNIRLSGQDVQRGTFSHRQAVWTDQKSGKSYTPFSALSEEQGSFNVYNSPLSEYAVLGFDYGYSLFEPKTLVIWEAQFGDFYNGAQIIVDQYLMSAEQKWQQYSHLVLLLPHGYEGQGPEHSSARIERFLQLCADRNVRLANPTTPAQLFHLLRGQMLNPEKKPLIVFTPKALLRHPLCRSKRSQFTDTNFLPIIKDQQESTGVKRLILCSGKVFYDLLEEREKRENPPIALVRIEQLYPLHPEDLKEVLSDYSNAEVCWVQEEHANLGAWTYIAPIINKALKTGKEVCYIGRKESSSTAAGSFALHEKERRAFIEQAFDLRK